ncbi:hypothetical protein ACQP6C_09635 [Snodgrassella alvi]
MQHYYFGQDYLSANKVTNTETYASAVSITAYSTITMGKDYEL